MKGGILCPHSVPLNEQSFRQRSILDALFHSRVTIVLLGGGGVGDPKSTLGFHSFLARLACTGARVRPPGAAEAGERLHGAAAARAAHIERLKADVAAAELAGCTFAPQLETRGRAREAEFPASVLQSGRWNAE